MNGTLNKVMLIGHLGDDVKMHYFDGGNCIGRFPLATNEVYINKSTGEKINSIFIFLTLNIQFLSAKFFLHKSLSQLLHPHSQVLLI